MSVRTDRKGDFIGVYNGGKFWPLDPHKEDVDFIGIAHALSQNCRFIGNTKHFWSVAQHSLLVENILVDYLGYRNSRIRLLGLLHDASEAYLSDLLRPFKKDIKGYKDIEEKVQTCIYSSFGLDDITPYEESVIKQADDIALAVESKVLMVPDEDWTLMKIWKDEFEKYTSEIKIQNAAYIKGKFIMAVSAFAEIRNVEFKWLIERWYSYAKDSGLVPLHWDNEVYFVNDKRDDGVVILKYDYSEEKFVDNKSFHGIDIAKLF